MIQSYLEHGFSLIPVEARGKRPIGQWAHAQSERAGIADVYLWLDEGSNLGVVTGELSGVVVVDCDTDDAVLAAARLGMPVTPTATTGNGRHYFLAYQDGVRNSAGRFAPGLDVRGEGGFVVLPPSVHPSGREYRWVDGLSLEDVPLAPCPAWLLVDAQAPQNGREPGEWGRLFAERIESGGRNHRCAELAGYLLRKRVDAGVVEELLAGWNHWRCFPPMSSGEVRRTVRSIAAREERRRGEPMKLRPVGPTQPPGTGIVPPWLQTPPVPKGS